MTKKKTIEKEEWKLLARELFDQDASSKGDNESHSVSVDDTERKKLRYLSEKIDLHYKLQRYNTPQAFTKVKSQIRREKKITKTITLRALKIAAMIVLVMLIGSAAYFIGQNKVVNNYTSEVKVDDSGLSQIELADGTIVTLNRDTKINYPDQFGSATREVSIEGEAFFEVTPNPNKPFIIHAGDATIKVLGTSFTVNAYPESDRVEVIVTTGKVQFSKLETNLGPNQVIIDPGEKGTYENVSKELKKSVNYDPNYLAWKTRSLVFSETSLKEVLTQLNKVYRVHIEVNDPLLNELLLNAHFERETLDFILEVISSTHGLVVSKQGEHYLLMKKEA